MRQKEDKEKWANQSCCQNRIGSLFPLAALEFDAARKANTKRDTAGLSLWLFPKEADSLCMYDTHKRNEHQIKLFLSPLSVHIPLKETTSPEYDQSLSADASSVGCWLNHWDFGRNPTANGKTEKFFSFFYKITNKTNHLLMQTTTLPSPPFKLHDTGKTLTYMS